MSDGCTDAARGYHCKPATKKRKEPKRPKVSESEYPSKPIRIKDALPDGLYHAEIDTGDDTTIQGVLAVHDGIWDISNTKGVMLGGKYTVKALGRIPVEPI